MATRLSISTPAGADPRKAAQRLIVPPRAGHGRYLKSTLYPKVHNLVKDLSRRNRSVEAIDRAIRFVKEQYLPYLEFDVSRELTTRMAEYGRVKEALLLLSDPENKVPKDVAKKADELYQKFHAMGWEASSPTPASRAERRSSTGRYPPEDHPIWGEHGIMRGVIMERGQGGRPVYFLDDRFPPRNAKVYGHNGLQPGKWFPRQECLRFHGGHAQKERGISGHEDTGAYSIVVSGAYDDKDKDEGDIIYYSGEGAHGRDSSRRAEVKGNRALRASISSGRPVRVFRNAKGSGRFAPPCGIRYDGLYRVVGKENRYNLQGGLYERFELRRLHDTEQPDLEIIVGTSPTPQEQADFTRIGLGY